MIYDRLSDSDKYIGVHRGLGAALDFLRRAELASLENGVHEIDGRRLWVAIQRGQGNGRTNVKLEAHRRYIDVQYTIAGTDELCWSPTAKMTQPLGDYDDAKDLELFADAPDFWFPLPAGHVAILFPTDAHAAMQGRGEIHKAVVKMAVDW